jgi:chromosome segregation ATPase
MADNERVAIPLTMTISNDRLDRIEATLEKLVNDLSQMREEQGQMRREQNEMREEQSQMRREQSEIRREQNEMRSDQDRGRKWEDRTWDVIKWVGGISAALSISAAIALVGLVIRLSLSQQQ